jgi:hypothetical protein
MRRSWSSCLILSILSCSSRLSLSVIAIMSIILSIVSANPPIDCCSLRSNSCSTSFVANTRGSSSSLVGSFPLGREVDPTLLRGSTEGLWRRVGDPFRGSTRREGWSTVLFGALTQALSCLPWIGGWMASLSTRLEVLSRESATSRIFRRSKLAQFLTDWND